jgi:hypothetical protein
LLGQIKPIERMGGEYCPHYHGRGYLSFPVPRWNSLMSEREPYLSRVKAMGVVGVMAVTVIER